MRGNDYLFRGVDSFSVQRQQTERMQSEVAGMDANRLLNTNVDDLIGYFAEKYGIEVPELIEGEMVVDQREAQRDVSGDPMRWFFYDRHQCPIMVTGTEILLEVPFSGASLGIPLKRRPDAPATYVAPEVRRKLAPKLPPATAGAFKPEPAMEEAEYQHILGVMENMAHILERSLKVFYNLYEESLRTHFLVQLNGHYEGQATGETFNFQGKTDILVRSGDRNIFIAECKFWGGPANLTDTIEQLLGYLSWRDSKTAILVFNRNRNFSNVLAAIPQTVMVHPNFRHDDGKRGETGFRYQFPHKDDPAKLLHLTVLAFDVPRPENAA